MKPAVFRPAIASRWRCSIGSRTSACTPLMNARPTVSAYLSSSETDSRAWRMASGKGAFMGRFLRAGDPGRRAKCANECRRNVRRSAFFLLVQKGQCSKNVAVN